ncbi:MAG: hypothetical protein ACLQU1_33260 [Bryobacteraceae bacterium]
MNNVTPQSLALMTDDESLAAAAPYVRQLLLGGLMRRIPNSDGESFTVYLAAPEDEATAAQLAEAVRSLPPMLVLKDEIKH